MRFPQYDYALVKHRPQMDIALVALYLKIVKSRCLDIHIEFLTRENVIYKQIMPFTTSFRDALLQPSMKAFTDRDYSPASLIKIEELWIEVSRKCNLKFTGLSEDLEKLNEELEGARMQLKESLPELDEMGNLTGEELSKLVQRWVDVENYLKSVMDKHSAFETEWDRIRTESLDEVNAAIQFKKDSTIVQENQND